MALTLQDILGYTSLLGLFEAVKNEIPDPLPKSFSSQYQECFRDQGRYTRTVGQRQTSRLTQYGSPARRSAMKNLSTVDIKLMHTFEELPIDPMTMQALRNYDNYNVQKMGMQEVSRQIKLFSTKFTNLEIAMRLMILANGVLYWDDDGNLLPSSSGSDMSHSFQMNANNQNQLNGIITESWALPSTDIPKHLRRLKKRARQLTGYPLKYAIYGENIPTYLTQNDFVIEFLARNPPMQKEYLESEHGEVPNGLFGFQWIPAYEAFFEDYTEANQSIWPADQITFTPEPSEQWWEGLKGSYPVPKSIDIQPNAESAFGSNFDLVHGDFAYAAATHNPPSMTVYSGFTKTWALKNPDAIFQADVTP